MKKLKEWNNKSIKITFLRRSGNKYAYIKLGDTIKAMNGTYKITALDNEDNIFKAVNIEDEEDILILYAYELVDSNGIVI